MRTSKGPPLGYRVLNRTTFSAVPPTVRIVHPACAWSRQPDNASLPLSCMFRLFHLIVLLVPAVLQAQLMELSGGSMHVLEGTRVAIEGPITWQLVTNSGLVNDGTIEFGPEAVLDEALGSAIVGLGVETTSRVFNSAVLDNDPAGLGLSLSSGAALGAFTLTRGHVPFTLMNGMSGISRWYELITNDQPGAVLETRMRYDPSELNGLSATALDLYTSQDSADFWTPRSGEASMDPWAITASVYWPWTFITAFQADATTSISEQPGAGFRAWPTATSDLVHLEALGDAGISFWELRDAAGRLHDGERHGMPGARYRTIDLARYSPGLYLLRVNDGMVIKLVKQ
jgi:hypothetical protein